MAAFDFKLWGNWKSDTAALSDRRYLVNLRDFGNLEYISL